MVTAAQRRPPSVSVWKVLGVAAVVGIVAGVLLANSQKPPDDLAEAEALAAKAMPGGDPMVIRPEDAKKPYENMMAPDPRSLKGIPPYPGADPRRLISSHPGADQTMAISWFNTEDSPDTVLNFYERAFADSDIMYASHRYSDKRGYVSWFEHDYSNADQPVFGKGVLHMISVTQEGGHTTVLVSATEPQKILENLTPLPAGIRIPPGPTPQVMNLSEIGQQRATILATYEMGEDRLLESLQDLWKQDGWKVIDRREGENGTTLTVVLNQQMQTVVVDGRGERSAQLLITVEERPAPPQGLNP
jgi:hypothetical protein